jgi:transposase-like protein
MADLTKIKNEIKDLTDLEKYELYKYLSKLVSEVEQKDPNEQDSATQMPCCPRCNGNIVVKDGFKRKKQRYCCKECGRTFVSTTGTVMENSHYGIDIWKMVAEDTLNGNVPLDVTAKKAGFSHATAFNMRHKLLLALEARMQENKPILSGISELDETYVLECRKGKKFSEDSVRKPCKHGAKALKRGISNEQICIMAGTERDGIAYATTLNRAHPDKNEIKAAFSEHLANGSVAFTDGLKGYSCLSEAVDCLIESVPVDQQKQNGTANLNHVNGFHSMIQERYRRYRGVATKYLNRYNVLFFTVFRKANLFNRIINSIIFSNFHRKAFTVSDVTNYSLLSI